VALSGFKPEDTEFSFEIRDAVIGQVKALGGEVSLAETLGPDATHLLCPATSRTIKTMTAAASGRWLITRRWVDASTEQGRFVDEEDPSYACWRRSFAFDGDVVFLTDAFVRDATAKRLARETVEVLISEGRGRVVDSEGPTVTLRLVGEREKEKADSGVRCMTLLQMFEYIQPRSRRAKGVR
jgi:hypothetical protein